MLLINACKAESHMYDRPIATVGDGELNGAVRPVDEPSNDLGCLSLISFPSITQENRKT
jgi:hypothetical protein